VGDDFEGWRRESAQLNVNPFVLQPGEPMSMYHWETDQEDFLVLSGSGTLVIEGEERPLRQWDLVHCPARTAHTIIGAGTGPCVILAVGARDRSVGPAWGGYLPDATAAKYGVGVERETDEPDEAYAHLPRRRPTRYRDGWLP
jgi:oxalate decarboxylase/phosphoglucose isomerase-like protein (cupin superfamily)